MQRAEPDEIVVLTIKTRLHAIYHAKTIISRNEENLKRHLSLLICHHTIKQQTLLKQEFPQEFHSEKKGYQPGRQMCLLERDFISNSSLFKPRSHLRTRKIYLRGLLDLFVPLSNVVILNKSSFAFYF